MATLARGTRLGPYELTSLVGAGGMGEVYRARDTRLDRSVAVKVLPTHFAADAERRARLDREARAISSLSHPNVCALFDVGHQDGVDYLVMEYLEGETLDRRLQKGPLPLDQTLRIGIEIASALSRAHRQGLVHRDLKPANIMLTRTGAKLLDFGIAKPVGGGGVTLEPTLAAGPRSPSAAPPTPLTSAGSLVGTLNYMSPEQLEGRDVDGRSDLFALGAVIHEMATGRRAFEGSSAASLIASVLGGQVQPISSTQPLAPVRLDRVVRLCLAKDPEERWQSAHDLRLELEAIAEDVEPQQAERRSARGRWQERAAWALAVAALLGALGVVALRPASAPATTLRASLLPPPGITGSGALALSPDGHRVAFVGYAADGVPHLYVRALDAAEAQRLAGTEDASLPFWSPDGRSLGFFAQRRLKRVEVAGGPPRALAEITDARGGSWGEDGWIVFAPNPGDGLYRIAADGGVPEPLTRLDPERGDSSHRWPTRLPDGKHVVFLAMSNERERLTLRLAGPGDPHGRRLLAADSGALFATGHLYFARGQALLAQRFDPASGELSGEPEQVAEAIWRDPDIDGLRAFAVAPTGTLAWRPGGSDLTQLRWYDRQGREVGTLGRPGLGSVVALSPDGRRVARSVTDEGSTIARIWLLDLETGAASRLTFNRWNDIFPVWSPDGRRIAFTSDRTGSYNLYEKDVDGSGEERTLLTSEEWSFPEDWSRDGRLLAFSRRDPATKADIWVLEMEGAERRPRPMVATEADELQPRFSPDGRFVAYISDESGREEVYVGTVPPSAAKWQISSAGGFQPQWRADGGELYYLGPDLRLMAVAMRASGGNLAPSEPQELFPTRIRRSILKGASPYLADRAGQRFLVDTSHGAELSSPIHLVIGGGDRGEPDADR